MSISVAKLEALMDNYGTEERIRGYIRRCVSFHGFVSPWFAYRRVHGRFGFGKTRGKFR